MSMNKREQAELEAAYTSAALAWPTFEQPLPLTGSDVKAIVERDGEEMEGGAGYKRRGAWFWSANRHSMTVSRVCCDGMYMGRDDGRMDSWWRESHLFATFEDARRFLAWDVAKDCAQRLRQVQVMEEPQG